MATCTKCGKTNYEGVKYCTACGTPLSASSDNYSNQPEEPLDSENQNPRPEKAFSESSGSSKDRGIDPKILYIILGIVVIVILVFVIKYFIPHNGEVEVVFTKSHSEVYVDEPVTFTDKTKNANSWDWDFGDNSEEEAIDKEVTHTFTSEGPFCIKLTVNGKYIDSLKINVIRKKLPGDDRVDIKINISGPTSVMVGQKITYTDNTPGAKEWWWRMTESGEIDSREKSIEYEFNSPGSKNISVKNDRAINDGHLKIFVKPIPAPSKGGKPMTINPQKVLMSLKAIAKGNEKEENIFLKTYLGGMNVTVMENDKKTDYISFTQDLYMRPGRPIISVNFDIDPATNYISLLKIKTGEIPK